VEATKKRSQIIVVQGSYAAAHAPHPGGQADWRESENDCSRSAARSQTPGTVPMKRTSSRQEVIRQALAELSDVSAEELAAFIEQRPGKRIKVSRWSRVGETTEKAEKSLQERYREGMFDV